MTSAPTRRAAGHPNVDGALRPLLASVRSSDAQRDTALIEDAYEVARDAHRDQVRRSGDPYIAHPLGVAMILSDLGLDDITLAGALLHDAVEDTSVTLDDLEARFGHDVAAIVDGVTKLDRLEFDSREEQQAATMRKMLVAMAKDVRVLLIKLADRLHNMRTIASLPEVKQTRIAQETLDIYAPLAHRLGIQDVKWQLEDLAFAVLHPKRYAEIEAMVLQHAGERERYLEEVVGAVRARLEQLQINADVTGRPKHYWSIYEKMVVRGKEFAEINDLVGVRVIVDSVKDCYGALGSIHALWRPVQGRFKDYIAMPKFNLYQSLHTTVVGPQGRAVEFQIRTSEMHRRSEYGVAAHWGYKEQRNPAEDLVWLQRIVDWQKETTDPTEFMQSLKIDLEQDEVFVFTPKGRVITLPTGATPVDFAYAIHTEVGHRCIGARVNARLVPLDSALQSGDTCAIFTSKVEGAGPSRDWTQFVQTPRASSKIRQWFSIESLV
jgi:guanosine-3',5'-bis(diphosphate) 3'-pyrophosphohydrolase